MKTVQSFKRNMFLNLHNVKRWGGLKLMNPESDAQHTFTCQALILQLGEMVQEDKRNWNIKEACFRALIHDADEAPTMDIVRTLKYDNPEITKAIKETQSKLMRKAWCEETCKLIDDAKSDGTAEAILVNFFDTYAAFVKMREEVNLGNNYMASILCDCDYWMSKCSIDGLDPTTQDILKALRQDLISYCAEHYVNPDAL